MRKKGFTLIELLVVIAIIAILAAILFPIFIRVQQSARFAKCQSNVKQIASGCMMYEGDYDGAMLQGFNNGTWGDWYGLVNPYLRQMHTIKDSSGTVTGFDLRGIWMCPNVPVSRYPNGTEIDSNLKRCYGYNYAYLGGLSDGKGGWESHKSAEISKATRTIRVMEIWGWHHVPAASKGWGTAYCVPPVGDPATGTRMDSASRNCKPNICWPPGWHSGGRSVIAWCDGHVSSTVFCQPTPGSTSYPAGYNTGNGNIMQSYFHDNGIASQGNPYFRLAAPKP